MALRPITVRAAANQVCKQPAINQGRSRAGCGRQRPSSASGEDDGVAWSGARADQALRPREPILCHAKWRRLHLAGGRQHRRGRDAPVRRPALLCGMARGASRECGHAEASVQTVRSRGHSVSSADGLRRMSRCAVPSRRPPARRHPASARARTDQGQHREAYTGVLRSRHWGPRPPVVRGWTPRLPFSS